MSSTRNLIDAIASSDSQGIESAFNTAMAEKIAVKLDTMRQDVAKNMFNQASEAAPVETSTEA